MADYNNDVVLETDVEPNKPNDEVGATIGEAASPVTELEGGKLSEQSGFSVQLDLQIQTKMVEPNDINDFGDLRKMKKMNKEEKPY